MKRRIWFALTVVAGVALVALAAGPFEQWQRSGHANQLLAVMEATVEARGTGAAGCGRCHAQQGYVVYLQQLQSGFSGNIRKPDGTDADVEYLTSLGLTEAQVQPQTCTACHSAESFQLRIRDDVPTLPSGFSAQGVGKGAVCMTCHNTRNGRITWDAADAGRYTAPHTASQADVLMGKNSYFVNDTTLATASPHALFTGNACVTCHLIFGEEGHTFEPGEAVCTNCHGPNMQEEFVQEPTEHLLGLLAAAIGRRVAQAGAQIATVRAYDPTTGQFTDNFAVDGSQVTGAEPTEIRGQISLKLLLADGTAVYSQLRDVKDAAGQAVIATTDPLVRAAWNFFLIEGDDSLGVHNPRFARNVLNASIEALQ
ncbi:MAG: hypothetical protein HY335_10805 [Deinococcus sp.]|nr:hypothetical protein [Deinococcus sp.]